MSFRLVIKNTTRYATADLRRIILAAAKQAHVRADKRVSVAPASHGRAVRGRAYLGDLAGSEAYGVRLWLPVPDRYRPGSRGDRGDTLAQELAAVAVHEFQHTRGLRHRDMTRQQLYCGADVVWARDLPVRWREPERDSRTPAERGAARRAAGEARARAKVAEWQAKLTRAERTLRKWRDKLQRYERQTARRAAASASPTTGSTHDATPTE